MPSDHRYPEGINYVVVDGRTLTLEQIVAVARNPRVRVKLSHDAIDRVRKTSYWVKELVSGKSRAKGEKPLVVYGINTGFGSKASTFIDFQHSEKLQRNLILSHSAGVGDAVSEEVVRATILLRANALARGVSGIRVEVLRNLVEMLNKGVHPIIPAKGSLGASGDLAPLSHLALVLSTDDNDRDEESGEAIYQGKLMTGKDAMRRAGIKRIKLFGKEGLALNNGIQFTTAIASLALYDAINLLETAEVISALSFEALLGASDAFHKKLHEVRPHLGQMTTASKLRAYIKNSTLVDSNSKKVQDAYSLRCIPQVLGAVRDTIDHVREVVSIEVNSATDNPLIFVDLKRENKAMSGGNFHGEPIGLVMDFLAIAMCELGSISERRIFKLTNKNLNEGLPSMLVQNNGLNSGFMIVQYTAAALVSENKTLAHPATVDSIPTCEDIEDHVSMAPIAARKAREIIRNVEKIVAIEGLCAAQGIDLRLSSHKSSSLEKANHNHLTLGGGTNVAYQTIRNKITKLRNDKLMYKEIDKAADLVCKGIIVKEVTKALSRRELDETC